MIKDYIRWRDGLTEADRLDRQIARILGHSVPPPAPPVNRADTLGNNTTNSPINIVASASAAHCSGNNNNNNKHKSSGHNNFNPSAIRPGKAQIPVEIGHFSETSSNTVILNDNSTVNVSAPGYPTLEL
ncbi:unnamed protein product [Protopolystoma xenopodis]|uniref:Uncharacterized protein n=1 Tax=Protopolystoma xenopodis TaxID=117903 RepID=A0A3S5AHN5_9PLAT|nr:unnamed protein product [Protopolystoma xenopodis]